MNISSRKRSLKARPLLLGIALLMGTAAVVAALEFGNFTHFFKHKQTAIQTTGGQYTKGIKNDTTNKKSSESLSSDSTTSQPSSQPGDTKHQASDATSETLLAPTGTFANVYNANLDDQMGSTCNTSPGATCQILFTMGSTTKSLNLQTADRGGAVYWSWKPRNIGLTSGTWHITARATLDTQVKETSNDPLTLKVN